MQLNAYSILDLKTGAYSPPMFLLLDAVAYRTVIGAMENSDLGRFPADFVLVRVGAFDDQTGQMHPLVHVNLGSAASIRAQYDGGNVLSKENAQ